jgi:colanic acid/amylovoran biosynthesis glycosyltransferase
MKVYAFAEYYPNPFKAYLDAQFAQTISDGNDLSIFAFGSWGDPGNRIIAEFGLLHRTSYLPATPRQLPRFVGATLSRVEVRQLGRGIGVGWLQRVRARQRLVTAAQTALLPEEPPDLCFIHDLGTAVRLIALRAIYPRARIALYYHGGEVAAGVVRDGEEARAGFALADTVFTNTEHSRAHAVARGCPPDRIQVLPVGFDLQEFVPPPARPFRVGGRLRLVAVGRLSRDKGLVHAIDALAMVGDAVPFEWTIIGDGEERGSLERHAAKVGLGDRVRFVGTLPHQEVIGALASADAILLPSVATPTCAETQACVLQEAMLVGAMLIATSVGGVPESVPLGMHEFLVPPGDPAALAAAIRRLMVLPAARVAELARQNRRYCEEHYDVRELNRRMLSAAMAGEPRPSATY